MRLKSRAALTALTLFTAVALPSLGSATTATAAGQQVVSVPVSFRVVNENKTPLPCSDDDATYTINGHITGPAAALKKGLIPAAALYLHGDGVDERLWHYTKTPGHDYVSELARQGFVSVTITRLGYHGSGMPDGNAICFGSEATVAHQIIEQLRAGSYEHGAGLGSGKRAPGVQRIALAGHSASGFVAMAEAYSFSDIDALIVVASGEFVTPHVGEVVLDQQSRCPSSEDGYSYLTEDPEQAKADFFTAGADPAVVADFSSTRPKDACGPLQKALGSFVIDADLLSTIEVPVLCIAGDADVFFPHPDQQASLFTGSKDAKAVILPNTGHALTLEKSAPAFRAAMATWLHDHGF
jgi:pimeloyl-ACP methyl ester carboxylesterase